MANSTTARVSALVIVRHPLSSQLRGVVALALLLVSRRAPVRLQPFLDGRDIKQDTPGNFHGALVSKTIHICRQPIFHKALIQRRALRHQLRQTDEIGYGR